ncbi:MAG: 2-dehydropantoate 2-reductase [Candidatus Thalassarchaeaceae archaeon]|nr:2-dehydropantoate 2-reductase [Candidatus Thalassarchaeaceae archaeon]MEE2630349.1 2-dehydropantoate 2-reductase [Candidatus Thermoplasmatota archaeon]
MRIAVLGVGSVGGIIVGSLADTDAHILCVSRGQTAATLDSGLVLKTPEGAVEMIPHGRFALHDSEKGPVPGSEMGSYDVAIIAGKASSTAVLASIAKDLLSPVGVAMSIQNGLGHAENISHVIGRERVLAGSTTHSAWREGDGAVNWSGRGSISMGKLDGSEPSGASSSLLGYLEDSGLNPSWSSDIESVIWMKLLINVAINPVCAIAGVRNGALAEVPELWEQSLEAMKEAEEVAIASGVELGDFEPESFLREVVLSTSENRVSMLQDLMAGRKTEVDALCGAVIERGRDVGVPTPRNEMLQALVRGIEMSSHLD